jgi:hypothetical protein
MTTIENAEFKDWRVGCALLNAIDLCDNELEEEGGVILTSSRAAPGHELFKFVKVQNRRAGTPEARGLYVADPVSFGAEVFPLLSGGWNLYASFHTHPTFSSTPSDLDRRALFVGFKYNYIYSPQRRAVSVSEWISKEELVTKYYNLN